MFNSRQSKLIPFGITQIKVIVIGCGSIGSNAAVTLARIGVEHFELFDHDTVKVENIGPTTFTVEGKKKVDALSEQLAAYGATCAIHKTKYVSQISRSDVVILGVDSMEARRAIWNRNRIDWKLWVDARIGRDQASVFAITRNGEKTTYLNSLEWQTTTLPCGMKATAFICGGIVPGFIGTAVARWMNGLSVPSEMYYQGYLPDAPFFSINQG